MQLTTRRPPPADGHSTRTATGNAPNRQSPTRRAGNPIDGNPPTTRRPPSPADRAAPHSDRSRPTPRPPSYDCALRPTPEQPSLANRVTPLSVPGLPRLSSGVPCHPESCHPESCHRVPARRWTGRRSGGLREAGRGCESPVARHRHRLAGQGRFAGRRWARSGPAPDSPWSESRGLGTCSRPDAV